MIKAYLGIDIGSVSTNIVALSPEEEVLSKQYIRTNGQPIECVKQGLKNLSNEMPDLEVLGVGTTGSGRQLAGILLGADVVKNEITAHATASIHYNPEISTIFEIGGQDSKIIFIKNKCVVDFAMNTVCAAGTGSFLDHQAERLKVPIEKFGEMALSSTEDVRIAGRCTVFAESDMIAKQQFGFSKADIIKGLCEALVRNYINNLVRGHELKPPFMFQGGVAANIGIKAAFEKETGCNVIVPKYFDVMGAIGIGLLAKDYIKKTGKQTTFKGFECSEKEIKPRTFRCDGCANMCEVVEVIYDGEISARWGDKCGKWTNILVQKSINKELVSTV